jgi:hypothetical protein
MWKFQINWILFARPLRAEETLPVRSHRLPPAVTDDVEGVKKSKERKSSRKSATSSTVTGKKKKKRLSHRDNTDALVENLLHNGENGTQVNSVYCIM